VVAGTTMLGIAVPLTATTTIPVIVTTILVFVLLGPPSSKASWMTVCEQIVVPFA